MKKVLFWFDEHIEELIGAIMLGAVTVLIAVGVFCRYVMKSSLAWSDELARYCFIWTVFVGMGLAVKNNGNMKIDILEIAVPRLKPVLTVIQDLVYLAFLLYMIRPCYEVLAKFISNPQPSPALQMPMQYVYASFFVGVLLAAFRIIQKYYRSVRARLAAGRQSKEGTL
ncbi:TRAP transporter small permease [Oscillibacter sp.]|jgi:TRAP-type C4-dicarboxylate transport system permease small subunit|uniref:TRAP transporter small permease n=1 Tax=Oscillibacter sp. TaxID=1945593 RepID=UPI00216BC5A8|nr:TRAP transporter small permease [Oscillibacter sp.]MCI9648656.1 TRAP transporter small permease [Oscillibacter sp.]